MAKKKTADLNLTTVERPEARGYTVGSWAGQAQYACRVCAFDTLDLDAMLEHQINQHSVLIGIDRPAPGGDQATDEPVEPGEIAQGIYEVSLEEVNHGAES